MVKSGLIFGAGAFLLVALFASVGSPFCSLCVVILMGLGAGYVTGVFDKPISSPEATRKGAIAGAITGAMAILAQMLAAVIVSALYQTNQSLYVSLCPGTQLPDPGTFWVLELGTGCCIAIVNVGISAGLGIAGSAIWFSSVKNKISPNLPPAPGV